MRAYRVAICCILPLGIALKSADGPVPQPVVAIVTTSAVPAFEDTVQGIRRGLGPEPKVVMVNLDSHPEPLAIQLEGKAVRLVIAVGNNALDAAEQFGAAPIIATMVMRTDLASTRRRAPAGAVVLDLTFADVLAGLAKAFPGKLRAGMIRSPGVDKTPLAALTAQGKTAGILLRIVDCPRPEKLIESFLSLRDKVDFVWCPPDAALFNGTTVKPLVLASIENQLPVVGFSASFVRAGAAAGIYPDYVEVGAQTGGMARKYLAGSAIASEQTPSKIRVATNPRISRLLGLRLPHADAATGIVVIE